MEDINSKLTTTENVHDSDSSLVDLPSPERQQQEQSLLDIIQSGKDENGVTVEPDKVIETLSGESLLDPVAIEQVEDEREMKSPTLSLLFPEQHFRVYSTVGSTAVLYESIETPGVIYKVYKDSGKFPFKLEEAKTAMLLGEYGIGPKFIDFIPEEINPLFESLYYNPTTEFAPKNPLVNEVQLPSHEKRGKVSVLVMEEIDFDYKDALNLPQEFIDQEAQRLASKLTDLKIDIGDNEIVYDRKTGAFKLLDYGGCRYNPSVNLEALKKDIIHLIQEATSWTKND